jgi:hypothetical protein
MTVTLTADHARRLLFVRAEGPITLADIRTHLEEERTIGGLPYRELIDARGYRPSFSSNDVREVVALLRDWGKSSRLGPTAIVVDSDEGYGMIRMLESLVEDVCAVRPFRQPDEAEKWLANFPD